MSRRRVVITGLGALCGLGNDRASVWNAAKSGRSGAGPVTRYDPDELSCRFACEVRGFDADAYFGRDAKKLDLFSQFGVAAADEAVKHSGIDFAAEDPRRCGVVTGSGIGGLNIMQKFHEVQLRRGPGRVSPFFIPGLIVNLAAGWVSMIHDLKGPNSAPCTAISLISSREASPKVTRRCSGLVEL